jgi:hypothetical protein
MGPTFPENRVHATFSTDRAADKLSAKVALMKSLRDFMQRPASRDFIKGAAKIPGAVVGDGWFLSGGFGE